MELQIPPSPELGDHGTIMNILGAGAGGNPSAFAESDGWGYRHERRLPVLQGSGAHASLPCARLHDASAAGHVHGNPEILQHVPPKDGVSSVSLAFWPHVKRIDRGVCRPAAYVDVTKV